MMGWGETLRTAVSALNARRMRSLLTVLGILIGIAAVMLTVGLGQGAQVAIANQINSLGSNLIIVTPSAGSPEDGFRGGGVAATTLTLADAAQLADPAVAPDIAAVAPVVSIQGSLKANGETWTATVNGSTPEYLPVRAQTMQQGRFFTAADHNAGNAVVVLGNTVTTQLFGTADPTGATVQIGSHQFTVIGVLAASGSASIVDQDNQVVIPLTTFEARLASAATAGGLTTIYVAATDQDTVSAAFQQTTNILLNSHRVTQATQDFTVLTFTALIDVAAQLTGILTALLGGIAAISLLVGGIGVMNIMLVSVSERVREIGLRKALGATPALIRRQFLVEAAVLGMLGGIIGIALGMVGAAILTPVLDIPVTISWSATAIALAVSLGIGLVAGVYPASRAANLAPIDALRSE